MSPNLHQLLVSTRVGGAAVLAIQLARSASTRGFHCTAWVPGPGPARDAVAQAGLRHRTYGFTPTDTSRVRRGLAWLRLFGGLVSPRRPIVHVHDLGAFGSLRPALMMARARTVVHVHIEPDQGTIDWMLERPPDHVVTCAKYIAESIRRAVHDRGLTLPVTAVPNAVDTDRFVPGDQAIARGRANLQTTRHVVLMLANLSQHKGHATTIRALRLLVDRGVDAECWLVGEDRDPQGNDETALNRLSRELGLEGRVRFLGFRDDAPTLLQAADAFVLPSSREGLPLVILEAHATGTPVVASDIPGVLEIMSDGETGFVVPAGDAAGYADRLFTLFTEADVRARLVNAAREQVLTNHSWPVFESKVFEIYRSLGDADDGVGRSRLNP